MGRISGIRDPGMETTVESHPSESAGLAPALRKLSLAIGGGELRRRHWVTSGGIENVGFDLASVSLSWDFFAVQQEAEAGGVSRFYDDLVAGADRGMCGRDEGFTGDGFAVRHERDPGGLLGTDLHGESRGRLRSSHVHNGPGRLSAWLGRLGGRFARGTGGGCRRGCRVC
jgi:hypothetical protein